MRRLAQITKDLKWSKHAQCILAAASKRAGLLRLMARDLPLPVASILYVFVLRKKGSKTVTKERMKEEEIEKGDCRPPTRKVFFFCDFVGLEPSGT